MTTLFKIIKSIFLFFIKLIATSFLLMLIFIALLIYQNNSVKVEEYKIESEKLNEVFNNYKIIQLSDIHSQYFGENHIKLIKKIKKESPDLIVITGDLVDANRFDFETGVSLVEQLVEIAPVYYVYGNHEMILNDDPENNSFKIALEELGVIILNNKNTTIEKDGHYFNLLGIQDPSTVYKNRSLNYLETQRDITEEELRRVTSDINEDYFTVLLAHRPEQFPLYSEFNIDLILSGHTHAGQFRIPFFGGIYAPNQGFLPKYIEGLYTEENSTMIISRGLGYSKIPLRIFNTPEVVSITLKSS